MVLNILTNRWFLMVLCALVVFGEMFGVKKLFPKVTGKIKNEVVRRGVNVILGIASCFVLAASQMFVFCDILGAVFYWKFVIAATLGATLLYLVLEKVFGESKVNALGKAFSEFISRSDMFDGKLSADGAFSVAKKLLGITDKVDKAEASKEAKAVDAIVERLNGFLADGAITAEEKAEADKIINESGVKLDGNSTYETYKNLLNK